ncbi:hypothetical protein LTR84_004375 [Exophiala bonariae]|uniref:Uncharacterized protein n=1 Tax=Exophiala bonariae TaxID=1690606 RepID=A0AAV9N7E2_9EURO|nr:hypothetical protein LTR84_004375 [Exophiala bonariae]
MTRPKRTASLSSPSSSDPSKRVAFEIPASLRHLSSISRSLATNTAPTGFPIPVTASPRVQAQSQTQRPTPTLTQSQPRPGSQSSSQPPPPFHTTRPVPQVPPQTSLLQRTTTPVPNPKPWLGPPSREFLPATANKKPDPTPKPRPPRPPKSKPQEKPASNPTPTVQTPPEPALQPGEAPSLKTHPNLIASLIAQKRAENEAAGHRARWQRNQVEYRTTGKLESPGSQLMTELKIDATRTSPLQAQSRTVSNVKPPRPVPSLVTSTRRLPSRDETSKPATETVTIPDTKSSVHKSQSQKNAEPEEPDSQSVYGSPFSSPITEFLDQATDNAGLGKDTTRSNRQSAQPIRFNHQAQSSTTHGKEPVDWSTQNGNTGSSSQVGNQSPFTEIPQSHHQHQSPLVHASFPPSSSHSSQHQSPLYHSPHFQTGQVQTGTNPIPNSSSVTRQQYQYMNPQLPAAQQNIYKVDYPQQYSTSNSPTGPSMSMPVTMRQTNFAQQNFSNPSLFNSPVSYPNQPVAGSGMYTYPSPGSGSDFEATMTKPSTGAKRVFMTAADMVAAANPSYSAMRFGTKLDFTVNPSR